MELGPLSWQLILGLQETAAGSESGSDCSDGWPYRCCAFGNRPVPYCSGHLVDQAPLQYILKRIQGSFVVSCLEIRQSQVVIEAWCLIIQHDGLAVVPDGCWIIPLLVSSVAVTEIIQSRTWGRGFERATAAEDHHRDDDPAEQKAWEWGCGHDLRIPCMVREIHWHFRRQFHYDKFTCSCTIHT